MDAAQLVVSVRATGVQATAAQLGQVDAAGKKAAASTERLAATSSKAGGSLGGLASTAKQLGAAVGVAGVAGGIIAATKTVVGFDQSMRNVNSIAGLSSKKFQALSKQVNDLAGPTAQAPQTLADGLYQIVSSGFKAGEGISILRASAVAATAGLTDTETATTAVVGALNAYHLSAKSAAAVSDDLFQTVNVGVLSFKDLAQGIGPVLPFASKLGISLKEVGAMTATLTKAGIPAAESFTYQKGAMAALIRPSDQLAQAYKKLGVSSGGELVQKTGSFQAALEALYKATGSNTEAFAKLFPDIRGMTAAFAATGKGAAGAAGDLAKFSDTSGATQKVFAEQSKSMAVQWRQLVSELQSGAIDLGQQVLPTVVAVTHDLTNFVKQMRDGTGAGGDFSRTVSDISDVVSLLDVTLTKGPAAGGLELAKRWGLVDIKPKIDLGGLTQQVNNAAAIVSAAFSKNQRVQAEIAVIVSGNEPARVKLAELRALSAGVPPAVIRATIHGDQPVRVKLAALSALAAGASPARIRAIIDGDKQVATKLRELEAIRLDPKIVHVSAVDGATGIINIVRSALNSLPSSKTTTLTTVHNEVWNYQRLTSKPPGRAAGRSAGRSETALVGEGGGPEWIGSDPSNMRMVSEPTLMSLGASDYVIPTEARYAARAARLWRQMGVAGYAKGKKGKRKHKTTAETEAGYAGKITHQYGGYQGADGIASSGLYTGPNLSGAGFEGTDPLAAGNAAYIAAKVRGDKAGMIAALSGERGIAQAAFADAQKRGDVAGITKWGQTLLDLNDSIEGLTSATEDQTTKLQAQIDVQSEILRNTTAALGSSQAEIRAMGKYIFGLVSGQTGQAVGRAAGTPPPMRLASY